MQTQMQTQIVLRWETLISHHHHRHHHRWVLPVG